MTEIEVVGLRCVTSRGNLLGLADVRIDGIIVQDFRIIQEPNRQAWVSVPQLEYRLHDSGERYYKPLLVIPKELRDRIGKVVLAEFERVYRLSGDGKPIGGCYKSNERAT